MKKYLVLIRAELSTLMGYRFEFLFKSIVRLFEWAGLVAIWSLSAKSYDEMNQLFLYYFLMSMIISPLQTSRTGKWIAEGINSGELNTYLIKDINWQLTKIIKLITEYASRLLLPLILFLILNLIYPHVYNPYSFLNLIFFFIFTILGIIIWNLINMLMSNLAFWLGEIGFIFTVIDLTLVLVNGKFIPAYLYPDWFKQMLLLTSIPYFSYYPIDLYTKPLNFNDVLFGILVCIFWFISIYFLHILFFKKGLKAYEGFGN